MIKGLEYPITRPIALGFWFNLFIILGGVVWITVITIINVAAVGYELVPFTSTIFNASTTLWYERFTPMMTWFPQGRTCDGSIIKIGESVSTNITSFFDYILAEYLDEQSDSPVDGIVYQADPLVNCSMYSFFILQYASSSIQDQALLGCNTSTSQFLALQTSREVGGPSVSYNALQSTYRLLPSKDSSGPLNISLVLAEWYNIITTIFSIVVPIGEMSMLLPSVVSNNLSSLRVAYYSSINSTPNTPADDSWTLFIGYTPTASYQEILIPITFLPTGAIDSARTTSEDLDEANALLAPTIGGVPPGVVNSFDVWKLLNWVIVSYYWISLFDFGQTAPTYYRSSYVLGDFPNFTEPISYTSMNNIFVNETLFDIYSSTLREEILPFLELFDPTFSLEEFLPLDLGNTLQPIGMSLLKSYSCVERRLKGWFTVAISVFVADYALIGGAYTVIVFIAGCWQKHGGCDANVCEGCIRKADKGDSEETGESKSNSDGLTRRSSTAGK